MNISSDTYEMAVGGVSPSGKYLYLTANSERIIKYLITHEMFCDLFDNSYDSVVCLVSSSYEFARNKPSCEDFIYDFVKKMLNVKKFVDACVKNNLCDEVNNIIFDNYDHRILFDLSLKHNNIFFFEKIINVHGSKPIQRMMTCENDNFIRSCVNKFVIHGGPHQEIKKLKNYDNVLMKEIIDYVDSSNDIIDSMNMIEKCVEHDSKMIYFSKLHTFILLSHHFGTLEINTRPIIKSPQDDELIEIYGNKEWYKLDYVMESHEHDILTVCALITISGI